MAAAIRLSQQHSCSFNHLVGQRHQRGWNFEAEPVSRREVDDQVNPGRLHYRQVGWLLAPENAAYIDTDAAINVSNVGSIAYEPARPNGFVVTIYTRPGIACCKGDNLVT